MRLTVQSEELTEEFLTETLAVFPASGRLTSSGRPKSVRLYLQRSPLTEASCGVAAAVVVGMC